MSHPSGIVVDIVGIEIGDCGCSCEEHEICGSVVNNDMVIHLQKELFFVFVYCNCLAYHDQHCHDIAVVVMLTFCHHAWSNCLLVIEVPR